MFGCEIQFARGGVERGEKLVFGQYVGFGKAVEQCGFAGIRVAHDGKGFHAAGLARFAACFALFFHLRQLPAQGGDFGLNQAAVGFELGFAGAFQADAAFLALQVSVSAHQPSGQVGQLRQFHLQPAFLRLGALGENRQNQADAVEHAALQGAFQITFLRGGQFVIEHHQFDIVLPNQLR